MTARLIRSSRAAAMIMSVALLGESSAARAQAVTQAAPANDPDPWFGRDKFYHFTVSAALASTTYAITSTQFHARYPPIVIGAGISLSIGAGKETLDAMGYGDPSWKDFAWDVIGTIVGTGFAWALDLATHPANSNAAYFGDR